MSETNLERFMAGHRDYVSLRRWAVDCPNEYRSAVWRFCGIKGSKIWGSGDHPLLNFAENLLRYQDDEPALVSGAKTMSHRVLYNRVSRMRQALAGSGIAAGDAVAADLPNIPEAVIAMLATASLGALWVACPADEFCRHHPKALFSTDRDLPGLASLVHKLPELKLTIVMPLTEARPDLRPLPHALRWRDQVAIYQPGPMHFEQFPAGHPLYVLDRKVGGGAALMQFLKELVLEADVRPNSRVYCRESCDSVHWYRAISALATGATVVLGDGPVLQSLCDPPLPGFEI